MTRHEEAIDIVHQGLLDADHDKSVSLLDHAVWVVEQLDDHGHLKET